MDLRLDMKEKIIKTAIAEGVHAKIWGCVKGLFVRPTNRKKN